MGRLKREQPVDDRLEVNRAIGREGRPRCVAGNRAVEIPALPRILEIRIRPVFRHHLVEHDAERPEVRVHVDALGAEAFRRRIRHRAAHVGRQIARLLEYLRHAEVEHLPLARLGDLQMRRFEIVVQQPIGPLLDGCREPVRPIEELAQPQRMADCFVVRQGALAQELFQRGTLDELHRDVEVVAVRTVFKDLRHHAVLRRERLLEDRAVPLGRDRAGAVLASMQDDLQRRDPSVTTAAGTKDGAELAAADRLLVDDVEVFARHYLVTRLPVSSSPWRPGPAPSMMSAP